MKLLISVIAVLLATISSISTAAAPNSPEFAKKELADLRIEFSDQSFVDAACNGNEHAVQLFIQAKIDINAIGKNSGTALHCAARTGNLGILNHLIAGKADVNASTNILMRPLHMAVIGKQLPAAQALLDAGANINAMSSQGPPLFLAVLAGREDFVRLFAEREANINLTDKWGGTALNVAMQYTPKESMIKTLLDSGAKPNAKAREGSALYQAVQMKNINLVRMLIAKGADPRLLPNDDGSTPLHAAARLQSAEIATLLIEAKADVNAAARSGTPLHVAARAGSLATAILLLNHGADVHALDCCNKTTPLHNAVINSSPAGLDLINILLARGADVNARDNSGRTPLTEARNSELPVVKILVEHGANVNNRDLIGDTSVLSWYKRRNSKAISYLIENGAKD